MNPDIFLRKIKLKTKYKHKYQNNNKFYKLTLEKFLNYVWPEFPNSNDPTYHALYEQNIWNGIIMYRKYDDCIESFAFASTKENRMLKNFYADGINVLNKYILYLTLHSF